MRATEQPNKVHSMPFFTPKVVRKTTVQIFVWIHRTSTIASQVGLSYSAMRMQRERSQHCLAKQPLDRLPVVIMPSIGRGRVRGLEGGGLGLIVRLSSCNQ